MSRMVEKIQKLLARTTDAGASEAEAQAAMDMAARLMDEYQLTEADLAHEPADDKQRVDDAEKGQFRAWTSPRGRTWEMSLAGFISELVGVPAYCDTSLTPVRVNGIVQFTSKGSPRYGKSVVFYGIAEDAKIAVELYRELHTLIATMATAKWGSFIRGDGPMYSQGFVSGMYARLRESRACEKTNAKTIAGTNPTGMILVSRREDLVAYKKTVANNWLAKSQGVKLGRARRGGGARGSSNAATAWQEGSSDGRQAEVSVSRSKKLS